ncbi:hypothetical protein COOONC_24631, partial [Cooperia oncophora]
MQFNEIDDDDDDRSRGRGGGVCCLVKGNCHVEFVTHIKAGKADGLCVDLFFQTRSYYVRIITIYRPPNSTKADDDALIEVLGDLVAVRSSTVVLGDLNLQVDWSSSRALNSAAAAYMNFFRVSGLRQHVMQPTHNGKVLDLILSTSHNISNVSVLPPLATSDHNVVSFDLLEESSSHCHVPRPDFLSTDFAALNNFFLGVDWWALFDQYSSMDDIYQRFCGVVYSGLAKTVPFKSVSGSGPKYPRHITNLLQQKQRLFSELSSPLGSAPYRKVCSDLDHHLRKFLANYERRLGSHASLQRLFHYFRRKLKPNQLLPTLSDHTGRVYRSDADKAEALANHFSSIFTSNFSHEWNLACFPHVNDSLTEVFFDPYAVSMILKKLHPSTSEPYDGIPQIVYKKCHFSLCKPLAMMFNLSFLTGDVPQLWKDVIITPIQKSPKLSTLSNFRPISLAPTPVK